MQKLGLCILIGLLLSACEVGIVQRETLTPAAPIHTPQPTTSPNIAPSAPPFSSPPAPAVSPQPTISPARLEPSVSPQPALQPTGSLDSVAQIVQFAANPTPADPNGTLTLYWQVRGANSVTIEWLDKHMDSVVHSNLPLSGELPVALAGVHFEGDQVRFSVAAMDASGRMQADEKGWAIGQTITAALKTDLRIVSFSAAPDAINRGDPLTLAWDAPNANRVSITRLTPEGIFSSEEMLTNLAPSGSVQVTVPDEYTVGVTYYLGAADVNGIIRGATLTVRINCPYAEHMADECPLTQQQVQVAYQPFEKGALLWRGDTRQIYALYTGAGHEIFQDTWNEGEPVNIEETPPAGLLAPVRGFGKLWLTQSGVRSKLGWATAPETGYTTTWETTRDSFGRYPLTGVYFRLPDNHIVYLYGAMSWRILP